ncbi:hypothetical protein T4B_15343 [Trichinella pseudospiralis]|uniref:Uncharacterized protein n=1 Tax=Trichinella pseudospiralis TaxID=6337 RepID=A0A0V1IP36_TRIPS|nr:hypothetical protein T4B_15343 [Trichinella pseudospiralis]
MELAYLFVSFVHLASSARLSNEKRFWHTIWEFRLKSSLANVHDLNIKRDDDGGMGNERCVSLIATVNHFYFHIFHSLMEGERKMRIEMNEQTVCRGSPIQSNMIVKAAHIVDSFKSTFSEDRLTTDDK